MMGMHEVNALFYVALGLFSALAALYGCYFAGIAVRGFLFSKRRCNPAAAPQKRIAALIPARNEEQVIAPLVESLMRQRYPRALFDVYVVVNNCVDGTRAKAERAGAKILSCDRAVHSKGEVLRFAFDALKAPEFPAYDAFCVFDADNLVDGGFLQAANNALCNGYHIAQAYRDSKNPGDNWVAGCTATFFWFMSRLYNESRSNIGMSAALNGTGIVFSAQLIGEMGYHADTLTEDQELTAQCALAGYKIGWMGDAVIYDEQPVKLLDSFTQRRRWGAGTMQCSQKYLKALLRKGIREKNWDCLDTALLFMGAYVQAVSCMPAVLTIALCVVRFLADPVAGLYQAVWALLWALAAGALCGVAFVGLIALLEKKTDKIKGDVYALMWLYLFTWAPANLLSLFTRPPAWKSIEHSNALTIDECERADETLFRRKLKPARIKGDGRVKIR